MKKILSIYDFLKEMGGLERVMFFQANKLKDKYDIELLFGYISNKDKEKIVEELELEKDIKISQLGKIKNEYFQLASFLLTPSRIKKINSDLIISHSFMASRIAYKKKKKMGTPYIVVLYHPPNFLYSDVKNWANNPSRFLAKILGKTFGKILKKLDANYVKNADMVLAISDYTAGRVRKIYHVEPEIVYPQISNFFKLIPENSKRKFLKDKGIKNKFSLAHGRVIPDKNYKTLLRIIKKSDIDLIISGGITDIYKKDLEEEIRKLKLKNKVKILGKISREDLLGYYNTAELFLMPAEKEDFGLTMVEALACGCPVVAWNDCAGPSEIINESNGFLAKPYDLNDFSLKIKEGLENRKDRRRVALTVEKFTEKQVAKKLRPLVDRLLNS